MVAPDATRLAEFRSNKPLPPPAKPAYSRVLGQGDASAQQLERFSHGDGGNAPGSVRSGRVGLRGRASPALREQIAVDRVVDHDIDHVMQPSLGEVQFIVGSSAGSRRQAAAPINGRQGDIYWQPCFVDQFAAQPFP